MNNIAKAQNLIIREIVDNDFEALCNLLSNKEVMRYSVRGPYSKEQTKDLMLFILDRYKKYPLGIWAVTEKHNDIPIGICGFIPLEEDDTQYEIIYRLLPDFQGKGFALSDFRLRPKTADPRLLNKEHWEKAWQILQEKLPGYSQTYGSES